MLAFFSADRIIKSLVKRCEILNDVVTGQKQTLLLITRVDPLTSILAVLVRSCQILTTSWQPWN